MGPELVIMIHLVSNFHSTYRNKKDKMRIILKEELIGMSWNS